jgi:putative redox protein
MTNVTASLKSNTAVDIRARRFLWRSDEPKPVGGADSGPTPYEFLLGSLAACTAMTLRLHANNTNIPLSGVDITLEYDREHAEDCTSLTDNAADLATGIRIRIMIHGQVTELQRTQLTQVAEQCPVHKMLASPISIRDTVHFLDTTD